MPDSRSHRGAHPKDAEFFAPEQIPRLQEAVRDLSFLRTRGYAEPSAVKLVGDRYQLTARQRSAVGRTACSDSGLDARQRREILNASDLRVQVLAIDGFNLITTVEAAIGEGVILVARDGCLRDLTSMHGNYRLLRDTRLAVELIMDSIARLAPARVRWYLDQPVSNSGRLRALVEEVSEQVLDVPPTEVELVPDPDPLLARASEVVVVTADSQILDQCERWFNLARHVVKSRIPDAWLVDLGPK